ncbi:hypothetical protein PINS_up000395 [Pythium insidiosum]|nr:hypothetical protein PINS_up000395 [Pythium insidiosum]
MRPREVPVHKPSTEAVYIPHALLREERAGQQRARWLPNETRPGASKHLNSGRHTRKTVAKLEDNAYVSDGEARVLGAIDQKLNRLDHEMDEFVRDFYVAAASFMTQARAQRELMAALRTSDEASTPHSGRSMVQDKEHDS